MCHVGNCSNSALALRHLLVFICFCFKVTPAGLEPSIGGYQDQRLIHYTGPKQYSHGCPLVVPWSCQYRTSDPIMSYYLRRRLVTELRLAGLATNLVNYANLGASWWGAQFMQVLGGQIRPHAPVFVACNAGKGPGRRCRVCQISTLGTQAPSSLRYGFERFGDSGGLGHHLEYSKAMLCKCAAPRHPCSPRTIAKTHLALANVRQPPNTNVKKRTTAS